MRNEGLKFTPDQVELFRRLDISLSPEDFSRQFPYLLRSLRVSDTEGRIVCSPQSGELYRYGVYFYALPEGVDHGEFVFKGSSFLLIPSQELFYDSGIDPLLTNRGIAVQQSSYYQHLLEEKKLGGNSERITDWIEYYRRVEEENITLDFGKALLGISPPIFSVPCKLNIDRKYLSNKP